MKSIVFPGQGSQCLGMGFDLYKNFSFVARRLQEAEDVFGIHLVKVIFGDHKEEMKRTLVAQPGLLWVCFSLMEVMEKEFGLGLEAFSLTAGHSFGEYIALTVAGVFSYEGALELIKKRCTLMERAPKGSMVAVLGEGREKVGALLKGISFDSFETCEMANDNGPSQVILSGHVQALEKACVTLKAEGLKIIPLSVEGPFHSSLMQPVNKMFQEPLETIAFCAPKISVVTNVSAQPQKDPLMLKEHLREHMVRPVRWTETVACFQQQGITEVVEVGPGKVLSGLVKKIEPSLMVSGFSDQQSLQEWLTEREACQIACAQPLYSSERRQEEKSEVRNIAI